MAGKHEGIPDTVAQATALQQSQQQMTIPKASFKDFISYYGQWKNGKVLLGAAGSWFFLDVAFYGLSLNTSTVLGAIGYGKGDSVYKILYNLAAGNCILICAGAIPGYWMTVATVDTIGRKPIQLGGFIILTILFIVWGFDYNNLKPHGHLAIYVLVQFFFQFGKFPLPLTHSKLTTPPFRSQRNNIHRPRRMFPNPLSLHLPRLLRRYGQNRLHHRPSRHRTPPHPWRNR